MKWRNEETKRKWKHNVWYVPLFTVHALNSRKANEWNHNILRNDKVRTKNVNLWNVQFVKQQLIFSTLYFVAFRRRNVFCIFYFISSRFVALFVSLNDHKTTNAQTSLNHPVDDVVTVSVDCSGRRRRRCCSDIEICKLTSCNVRSSATTAASHERNYCS